jgi:flavin-dependent dehydrogenase
MRDLWLHNGSRIAIVGAGPAGTFFAHFALKLARQKGLQIAVTLFDGKSFMRLGPPGCNMCAGVISETLHARLEEEGIQLPEGRVQRRIDAYHLHTRGFHLPLAHPQGKKGAIRTVYRGSGPRFWSETSDISFDDFLLNHAKEEGARVIEKVVREIILPSDAEQPVRLLCGSPGSYTEHEADLVVGAFGLNTAILEKIVALEFGYRPPRWERAFQAELELGADHIRNRLGNSIHVFSPGTSRIRFAALTPKREHVTVSMIGSRSADISDLRELLAQPLVRRLFPPGDVLAGQYCRCRPRIAITAAKKPFTDRFVIVGDASCSRYYKNGIESAFITAQFAAEAAFNAGISESALKRHYLGRVERVLIRDNFYGRLLFRTYDLISRNRLFAQTYYLVASSEQREDPIAQLARQILWDMLTGNAPYRTIFYRTLDPRMQSRLTITTLGLIVKSIGSRIWSKG